MGARPPRRVAGGDRSSSPSRSRWPSRGRGRAPRPRRAGARSSCSTRRGRCSRETSSGETRWQRAVRQARALAAVGGRRRRGAGDHRRRAGRRADDRPGADRDRDRSARARGRRRRAPGRASPAPITCTSSLTARVAPRRSSRRHRALGVRGRAERRDHRVRRAAAPPAARPPARPISRSPTTRRAAGGARRRSRAATVIAVRSARRPSPPAKPCSQVVPLPADRRRAAARDGSSAPDDALAIDDEAVAWIDGAEPLDGHRRRATSPAALAAAAPARSGVRVDVRRSRRTTRPGREDVVVFDRWLPAAGAGAAGARHRAAGGRPGSAQPRQRREAPRAGSRAGTHPVLAGVDPLTVDVKTRRAATTARVSSPIARVGARHAARVCASTRATGARSCWSFALGRLESRHRAGVSRCWSATRSSGSRVRRYGVLRQPGSGAAARRARRASSSPGRHSRCRSCAPATAVVARLTTPGLYLVEAGGSRGVVGVNVGDPEVVELWRGRRSRARTSPPWRPAARAGRGGCTACRDRVRARRPSSGGRGSGG